MYQPSFISGTLACRCVPLIPYLAGAFVDRLSVSGVAHLCTVDLAGQILEDKARVTGAYCRVCGCACAVLYSVTVDLAGELSGVPVETLQTTASVDGQELLG